MMPDMPPDIPGAGISAYLWPALWTAITVALYLAARRLQALLRNHAAANTVIITAGALIALLHFSPTCSGSYSSAGGLLLRLLGPATVALAVPLYQSLPALRRALWPSLAALAAGSSTAVAGAIGIAALLGAHPLTLRSLAPKSVTTPIAMAIARSLGGAPPLAAVFVIATGAVGALTGAALLDRLGVRDARARGLAIGVSAHGMGTARAFELDPLSGVFSTLAMTLNGVATALLLPALGAIFWR